MALEIKVDDELKVSVQTDIDNVPDLVSLLGYACMQIMASVIEKAGFDVNEILPTMADILVKTILRKCEGVKC